MKKFVIIGNSAAGIAAVEAIRKQDKTSKISVLTDEDYLSYCRCLISYYLAGEVKEENFRYPGPKPQTKESAIILLADSVEAASRTLTEPTPSSIRNLVRKMINNKFIDAQLDGCDLTLKDMHDIADSFVRVLMGVFHTRLDYPEDNKKTQNGIKSDDSKPKKPKQKDKN